MPINQIEIMPESNSIISGGELIGRDITDIPKLCDPIIPTTGLVAIAGESDQGKSALARQFAISIAGGRREFLGFPLKPCHNRAIYVSSEDDEDAISVLLKKQNQFFGYHQEQFDRIRFIFDADTADGLLEKLSIALDAEPADAVIVDTWTDIFNGQLNAGNEVRGFLNKFRLLALQHKTAVIFVHHIRKGSENFAPSKHNLIGSQAFEAKMRTVFEVRKDNENPNEKHLCIVKGNYLDSSFKNESFKLQFNPSLTFSNTSIRVSFDQLHAGTNGRSEDTSNNPQILQNLAEIVFNGSGEMKHKDLIFKLHNIDSKYNAPKCKRIIKQWVEMEVIRYNRDKKTYFIENEPTTN